MTVLFFLYVLGGIAFVLAFFTATFGYLRAKIAAAERERQAEEARDGVRDAARPSLSD